MTSCRPKYQRARVECGILFGSLGASFTRRRQPDGRTARRHPPAAKRGIESYRRDSPNFAHVHAAQRQTLRDPESRDSEPPRSNPSTPQHKPRRRHAPRYRSEGCGHDGPVTPREATHPHQVRASALYHRHESARHFAFGVWRSCLNGVRIEPPLKGRLRGGDEYAGRTICHVKVPTGDIDPSGDMQTCR